MREGSRLQVGENIRDLRKKKRVRQTTLARMVGISAGAPYQFREGPPACLGRLVAEDRRRPEHAGCVLSGGGARREENSGRRPAGEAATERLETPEE